MARQPFIVIPHEPVSIEATNAAPGRPASHMAEYLHAGMVWRMPTAQPSQTILMDLGAARDIDHLSLIGTTYSATTQANMILGTALGSGDIYGSPQVSIPPAPQAPNRPDSTVDYWNDLPSVFSARYVGVNITGHTGLPYSAQFLVVGKRITFQRYAEHDWEVGVDDQSQTTITRDGVPDIVEGAIMRTLSFTMKWVSEAEYFDQIALLDQAVGRRKPVLICFDPDAGPRRQALTYFGLLRENPRSRRINARAFERRFEILSFI